MALRKSTDSCLLCKINNSNESGSHLMPNFLLQYIVGKRDYEEAYTIDIETSSVSKYSGPANISNKDTTIRKYEHVEDFILCTHCEKKYFHDLETYSAKFFNEKLRGDRYKQQFNLEKISEEIILKKTTTVVPQIIHLTIFSVIWRIILKYKLRTGENLLNETDIETIRSFLANYATLNLTEIAKVDVVPPYKYSLISCENLEMGEEYYGYNYYKQSNPEVFLLGRYYLLLFLNHHELAAPPYINELLDSKYANGNHSEIQVLFVSDLKWQDLQKDYLINSTERFINKMAIQLSAKRGIFPQVAKQVILQQAIAISEAKGIELIIGAIEGFNNLMQND